MKEKNTVTLEVTRKELDLLHTAVCMQRGDVHKVIAQLAGLGLANDEARELENQLGELSRKICDLLSE